MGTHGAWQGARLDSRALLEQPAEDAFLLANFTKH
jgi:hypothetical protein